MLFILLVATCIYHVGNHGTRNFLQVAKKVNYNPWSMAQYKYIPYKVYPVII